MIVQKFRAHTPHTMHMHDTVYEVDDPLVKNAQSKPEETGHDYIWNLIITPCMFVDSAGVYGGLNFMLAPNSSSS